MSSRKAKKKKKKPKKQINCFKMTDDDKKNRHH